VRATPRLPAAPFNAPTFDLDLEFRDLHKPLYEETAHLISRLEHLNSNTTTRWVSVV
jgi:hypothetical protein